MRLKYPRSLGRTTLDSAAKCKVQEPSPRSTTGGVAAATAAVVGFFVAAVLPRATWPLIDGDVWWHIRAGEEVLRTGADPPRRYLEHRRLRSALDQPGLARQCPAGARQRPRPVGPRRGSRSCSAASPCLPSGSCGEPSPLRVAADRLGEPHRVAEPGPGAGRPGDGRARPGARPAARHGRRLGAVALPGRPAPALAHRPAPHHGRCGPTCTPAGCWSSCWAAPCWSARPSTGSCDATPDGTRHSPGARCGDLGVALLVSAAALVLNPNGVALYRYPFDTRRHHGAEPIRDGVVPGQPGQPLRPAAGRIRGRGRDARPSSSAGAGCEPPMR